MRALTRRLAVAAVPCAFAAVVFLLGTGKACAAPIDFPVLWNGVDPSWSFRDSLTTGGADRSASHGGTGDIPIMGDWDNDGFDEIGLVRNEGGVYVWYLSGTDRAYEADPVSGWVPVPFVHGAPGLDIPVVGDWNGDGYDTPGLVRNNSGTLQWILTNSHNQNYVGDIPWFNHGGAGQDIPIVGDWNGDGIDTANLIRNSSGSALWILTNNQYGGGSEVLWDVHGAFVSDLFVVGDWNGNGEDSIGLYRPGSQTWYLWSTLTNPNDIVFQFGDGSETYAFGATPVPEPTTMTLLALGGLGLLRRKRRRR